MKQEKIWCSYCGDREGIHKRDVKSFEHVCNIFGDVKGYKLTDVVLCDWCNHIDDKTIERYYKI